MLRASALLGLLTLAALPQAAAWDCVDLAGGGEVCTLEESRNPGMCETAYYEYGTTALRVRVLGAVRADAEGGYTCYDPPFGNYRTETRKIYAEASVRDVGTLRANWNGVTFTGPGWSATLCSMYVEVEPIRGDIPCLLGLPPPLPWGHILP